MSGSDSHGSDAGDTDDMQIRDLAYQLWDSDGRPEGKSDEYWYRAQQVLAHGAVDHDGGLRVDDEGDVTARPLFTETTPVG